MHAGLSFGLRGSRPRRTRIAPRRAPSLVAVQSRCVRLAASPGRYGVKRCRDPVGRYVRASGVGAGLEDGRCERRCYRSRRRGDLIELFAPANTGAWPPSWSCAHGRGGCAGEATARRGGALGLLQADGGRTWGRAWCFPARRRHASFARAMFWSRTYQHLNVQLPDRNRLVLVSGKAIGLRGHGRTGGRGLLCAACWRGHERCRGGTGDTLFPRRRSPTPCVRLSPT